MATNTTQLRLFAADSTPAAADLIGLDSLAGQLTIESGPRVVNGRTTCPGTGSAGLTGRNASRIVCPDCGWSTFAQFGHIPAHTIESTR